MNNLINAIGQVRDCKAVLLCSEGLTRTEFLFFDVLAIYCSLKLRYAVDESLFDVKDLYSFQGAVLDFLGFMVFLVKSKLLKAVASLICSDVFRKATA